MKRVKREITLPSQCKRFLNNSHRFTSDGVASKARAQYCEVLIRAGLPCLRHITWCDPYLRWASLWLDRRAALSTWLTRPIIFTLWSVPDWINGSIWCIVISLPAQHFNKQDFRSKPHNMLLSLFWIVLHCSWYCCKLEKPPPWGHVHRIAKSGTFTAGKMNKLVYKGVAILLIGHPKE